MRTQTWLFIAVGTLLDVTQILGHARRPAARGDARDHGSHRPGSAAAEPQGGSHETIRCSARRRGRAAPLLGARRSRHRRNFSCSPRGKIACFENRGDPAQNGGIVVVGRDRALRTLHDPTCPATSAVEVEAYLQSTLRAAVLAHVDLDCAKWSAYGARLAYSDPTGTVRSIRYTRCGLQLEVRGPDFTPISGPVGYLQAQLAIGDDILRARFHNFRRNDAAVVRSRRPSLAASRGEAGFWDALLGDDSSEAREQEAIALLETAVRRAPRDGRSHFLLGMLHLYRFGQRVVRLDDVSAEARAELAAGERGLCVGGAAALGRRERARRLARPRLRRVRRSTCRAPSTTTSGMRDAGLADLDRAIEINSFFNVFDYIPVMQFLPAERSALSKGIRAVHHLSRKPGNARLRRHAAGDLRQCRTGAAQRSGRADAVRRPLRQGRATPNRRRSGTTWRVCFRTHRRGTSRAILAERKANAAARVALYADADLGNDPPIIGAGPEACAVCHNR